MGYTYKTSDLSRPDLWYTCKTSDLERSGDERPGLDMSGLEGPRYKRSRGC